MFYLSSDMAERIRFDEWAFCHADECIRAAEVPVWELDIEEFARDRFALERELIEADVDDIEEAEARYLDAFRKAHRYALRSAVVDTAAELGFDELVGLDESHLPFERVTLLQMPSAESLAAIDEAAGHFGDNGGDPDGDLWLAPANKFNEDQLARASAAGGRVVDGYAVKYPRGVCVEEHGDAPLGPGWVALRGWCGYGGEGVAYALDPVIAAAVYAASALSDRASWLATIRSLAHVGDVLDREQEGEA